MVCSLRFIMTGFKFTQSSQLWTCTKQHYLMMQAGISQFSQTCRRTVYSSYLEIQLLRVLVSEFEWNVTVGDLNCYTCKAKKSYIKMTILLLHYSHECLQKIMFKIAFARDLKTNSQGTSIPTGNKYVVCIHMMKCTFGWDLLFTWIFL